MTILRRIWKSLGLSGILLMVVLGIAIWYLTSGQHTTKDKNPVAAQGNALQALPHSSGINLAIIEKTKGPQKKKTAQRKKK